MFTRTRQCMPVLLLCWGSGTLADPAPFTPAEPAVTAAAAPAAMTTPRSLMTGECVARDRRGDFLGWADYSHCLIDQHTLSGVRRFDDIFGMQDMPAQASYALRVISEMTIDERGEAKPGVRVRASVNLPRTKRRLALILEDDRQETESLRSLLNSTESALALRWLAVTRERLRIETDAGVRSGPDVFARARLRRSWALTPNDQLRIFQSVRYSAQEQLRATNETDISHLFRPNLVGSVYHVLDARDNEPICPCWSRGLLLASSLGDRATLSGGIGQDGQAQPAWQVSSSYAWLRWRQGFLRQWLFYEVEPRLTQTRLRDWDTLPSLTLRLEVRFGSMPIRQSGILDQIRTPAQQPGEITTTP